MSNLLQELAALSEPAPEIHHADVEDEADLTRARVSELVEPTIENGSMETRSALRSRASAAADIDTDGVKTSRSAMFDDNESDIEDMSDHDEILDRIGATVDFESDGDDDDGDDDVDDPEDDDDEVDSEASSINNDGSVLDGDEPQIVEQAAQSNISHKDQMEKGKCVASQQHRFERLIGVRVRLQKVLSVSASLPRGVDNVNISKLVADAEPTTVQALRDAQSSLQQAVQSLLDIDDAWLGGNRHTVAILSANTERATATTVINGRESDDSITSEDDDHEDGEDEDAGDEDEDMSDDDDVEIAEHTKTQTAVSWRKLPDVVTKRHKRYAPSSILRKWQEKTGVTPLASKGDRAHQVELLRHNRSGVRRLGQDDAIVGADLECFDDSEFYHRLLKQLIERKGQKETDSASAMTRQWLEVQRLRQTAAKQRKANVDTKASKARKIRYEIYKRIVNFMPPIDRQQWTHEAQNQLFTSLFQ